MKPISKRAFTKGDKVTVSIRLPESLKNELERIANEAGRGFSDFVQEGLDQWAALNKRALSKKS